MQNSPANFAMTGTPECYLRAPGNKIDIDALNCVLARMEAVCLLFGHQFDRDVEQFNDDILRNAAWALHGMIEQAQALVEGKR